ncbi:response regulator [Limnoglobus roseus]|uniref:PAS domain S-box protein n=1 Tax=Limnoglobus roseus TaxID=2598579 RepID=A0A5C1APE6_9BACT|nr:response regulator [Limnoglobus roseus]QEL19886.1 PAS domain S-box protein [Limnoglobus roseus]
MPTVLFADPDRDHRKLYVWLLTSYGCRVETAGDGLQCLGKLRRVVPDLLILDLELPWGGGNGVLRVMGDDPRLLPARVVLTSARASASELDAFASPPVVRVLAKPFELSALFERAELGPLFERADFGAVARGSERSTVNGRGRR